MNRRQFVAGSCAAGAALGLGLGATGKGAPAGRWRTASANEEIRIACIGLRGKGNHHMHGMESVAGAKVVALCDVDRAVLDCRSVELESRSGRKIKRLVDYRKLLDDPEIDAVGIATPNHSHALIAVAAMQSGKDVYVEKPCSHNLWEGRQLVRAARKHKRVCQHGTQGRSSPAIREAIRKLHEGMIGEVHMARAISFRWRPAIAPTPEEPIPPGVDYDLWLGPARRRPFRRDRFHYHWHWHWDYGSGDLGNQGLHQLDVARWGLNVGLATTIRASGGQFMFGDPERRNPLACVFNYPKQQKTLVFETRRWTASRAGCGFGASNPTGVTFYGSDGSMQVYYFGYTTCLGPKREPGPAAGAAPNEYERFIAGVRSGRREDLGVTIEDGHLSSALCHLGNISYRLRRPVHFDPETETFPGDDEAGAMLSGHYRQPYVVPEIA